MAFTCCACMLFCIVHLRVAIRMFKHMSNSISYSFPKWDLWMVAALVCVAVALSGCSAAKKSAESYGIIGGKDGPTAIWVTTRLPWSKDCP